MFVECLSKKLIIFLCHEKGGGPPPIVFNDDITDKLHRKNNFNIQIYAVNVGEN